MPISPFIVNLRKKVGTDLLMACGISAVVLNERRQVLLVRSNETDQWMPIGGMVEPGEEPADAAVREVFEETSVRMTPRKVAGVFDGPDVQYSNGDRVHYMTIVFLCVAISGEPHPSDNENSDARYFDPDQMPPLSDDHRRNISIALADRPDAVFHFRGG